MPWVCISLRIGKFFTLIPLDKPKGMSNTMRFIINYDLDFHVASSEGIGSCNSFVNY